MLFQYKYNPVLIHGVLGLTTYVAPHLYFMETPGRPHHVPDDDTVEMKKVTSSVEKARTGMRPKDPRLAQHCTRTWALPSPRGRPRRRICSCPSSAESGVSTQEMAPSGGSPRAEAPSPSSQQCATPRFLACNTASWTRYSLGTSYACHLRPWVLG